MFLSAFNLCRHLRSVDRISDGKSKSSTEENRLRSQKVQ